MNRNNLFTITLLLFIMAVNAVGGAACGFPLEENDANQNQDSAVPEDKLDPGEPVPEGQDLPEDEADGFEQVEQQVLTACPAYGRYCEHELGGLASSKRLYTCASAGAAPQLYKTCLNYCGIAGADRFSACVKPIRLNATDRAIFANPNLSGTALLWHNLVVQNVVTKRGGQGLTDTAKFETAPAELTNAGAQCAAFIQKSISGVPVTSQWFPIDADQLSIANALDGTVIATFNPTTRHYGVLPHTAAKCGTSFCDSNWNLDNIVRKHTFTAATLAKFSVVGIPE